MEETIIIIKKIINNNNNKKIQGKVIHFGYLLLFTRIF